MKKLLQVLFLFLLFIPLKANSAPTHVFFNAFVVYDDTNAVVSPNPALDNVIVKSMNSSYKITSVSILSMVGNTVMTHKANLVTSINLNVSRLTSGRYFVKVAYSNGYQEVIQLVKL